MLEKLDFAVRHYALLAAFVLAFWGVGRAVLVRAMRLDPIDEWLDFAMAVAVGMGVFMLAFLGLALGGSLRTVPIIGLLVSGVLLSANEIRHGRLGPPQGTHKEPLTLMNGVILVAILAASTLLGPLSPPHRWDELMYHLPLARQWALSGELTVNEWLRYAWFPYNFHLLFAAALVLYDDVSARLLHALAGWVVALLIFRVGVKFVNRFTACAATSIWLLATKGEYDSAYIDMGVTLFVFSACIAARMWVAHPLQRRWLWVACFLLGVGAGSKYQVLAFVPFFLAVLIRHDRRASTVAGAAAIFLVPCIYWYARNAILTGDPFNPIGGKLFGFTSWNLGDYEYQLADLKRAASWPPWTFWLAALAPLFRPLRQHPDFRGAAAFSIYAFAVWWVTSHYDRYLMPAYPVMALLSGMFLQFAWSSVAQTAGRLGARPKLWLIGSCWAVAIVVALASSLRRLETGWSRIATAPEASAAFLRQQVSGFRLVQQAKQFTGARIYQWGLEGAIYYAPNPIWGDHFGRWRYRDVASLNPRQLMQKLVSDKFDILLVHSATVPGLESKEGFVDYFEQTLSVDGHKAYRIRRIEP